MKALNLPDEQRDALCGALETASGSVMKKLLFAVRDEAGAEVFRRCVEAMERVACHD